MKYAIITGSSKGLGASIAERLIKENVNIVSVARTENEGVRKLAAEKDLFYKHFTCDLSKVDEVDLVFSEISDIIFSGNTEEVLLVNNAGVIEPIDKVGNLDTNKVNINIQVNLLAPIVISNLFLQKAKDCKLTIVNVTSGAGERPIQGWSTYCSTKAALNMFTKTTALEQQSEQSKHVIIGYSPGIMDTDMQVEIRSSSKDSFHDIETFKGYKEQGLLRSADVVANALVDLLISGDVQSGTIYNVNELLK
ncbi:(S)-benzoin forming benzil reductase [Bacillus sp. 31A1R]|uniref:(S)-benzoin forming benzil reductase n=1 Tax=Robertmurraya mangrovi TaxID=3098077 RepID=A0ABU5IYL4_9BACI|nr:(S)-benzoin forming benzil reductase [Bacillus sp. 31A1R]MDZ5472180.1 (S)-benzoin forming benzil reductase [Bacillus sp. 31A1R]